MHKSFQKIISEKFLQKMCYTLCHVLSIILQSMSSTDIFKGYEIRQSSCFSTSKFELK